MKDKFINFLIYGFGQSINILTPLLVVPFILSICKEDGLGKVGISFSISLILCCFIDYSSGIVGTKQVSINKLKYSELKSVVSNFFSVKIITTVISCLLLIVAVFTIPYLRDELNLYLYILPLLIAQLFNSNWILQGLEKFKLIALFNILSKASYLILVFLLIKGHDDYILVNFFLGISNLVFNIIASVYIFRHINISTKNIQLSEGFSIIKKDFNICISEFCLSIYQFFPIIIIGYFLGNSSAGIFKVIEQIISVFRTYIFMFFSFSYPTVCFDIEENKKDGFKTWLIYNAGNTLLIILGCGILYLIKDLVFEFFKVSQVALPTIKTLFTVAIIIPIFIAISQAFRQLLFALGIMTPYTRIIYISTFLNLILLIFMIQKYDLIGVLISMIMIETIVILSYSYFINKYYQWTLKH